MPMRTLINSLRPLGHMQLYRKGSSILLQGEIPRNCFIIVDGIVRAYAITNGGEERLVALYGPGDIFPFAWVLGQASTSLFYYDAVNDVRALRIDKTTLTEMTDKDPIANKALIKLLSQDYAALMMRITGLIQSRAVDKIAYTLYYLLLRYGIERAENEYFIDLKLSQGMLAQLIGQTRESTAKNIKILRDKRVISYKSSSYSVRKDKLEKFLGEDSFRDLELKG